MTQLRPSVRRISRAAAAISCATCLTSLASAQLRPDEVLVVYDSRITDSREVAAYYAGSRKVPGASATFPGTRPGVNVLDLASTGAPVSTGPDVSYPNFSAQLRDPIRNHIIAQNLTRRVRCLVLTKGFPHRIQDNTIPTAGDAPGLLVNELNASDATCASVDADLTLLYQNLFTNEAGGPGDSLADGLILNPYWKLDRPMSVFPNTSIQTTKTFTPSGDGPLWSPAGSSPQRLIPGEVMLVTRLDGPTVANVRGIIDRAKSLMVNPLTSVAMFDESNSNGTVDAAGNGEFDNSSSAWSALRAGDDYEQSRDDLTNDTRFGASFVRYNALQGGAQFYVGPRVTWTLPVLTVSEPVLLVATYGSNHAGVPRDSAGTLAFTFYADSYNYPPGAIFNTIESYNGRAFGGLGQPANTPQQQLSGFIAAGGTFGFGNVWEPIADSIPDNRYVVQNFIRGNLSWAESAWSSIPALSWMQLVVGDPLARVRRTTEDLNADSNVGVDDLYTWESAPSDVNRNGTTDAADRTLLINSIRSYDRSSMITHRP